MSHERDIAVDITKFFKLGSGPHAKTAQAHIVADLTETDPEALLREILKEHGHSPEDLAFIWFSPPCETNSIMQRVNEIRDTEATPVTWHIKKMRHTRKGPGGNLERKHDILALKWTQWLTS